MKEPDSQSDESGSDDELLAAAANWAESSPAKTKESSKNTKQYEPSPGIRQRRESSWSLHLTQVSYDASDYDIRSYFSSQGCLVSSVRLVYDRDEGGKRKFRGVAFVDVADEGSFQRGLELHRTKILGRAINVRPTKSREELNNIVEATQAKVSALMQKKSSKNNNCSSISNGLNQPHDVNTAEKASPAQLPADPNANINKPATDKRKNKYRGKKDKPAKKKHSSKTDKKKSPDRKLTKQDRAKRAAIIAAKVVKKRR